MKLRTILAGLLLTTAAYAADSIPVTFNAVLNMGKDKRFGVSSSDGAHTGWISLGNQFDGYKLQSFDEAKQTLVFEKDGKTYPVVMAAGSVETLKESTKATIAEATAVLEKSKFEEMLGKMIDQQKKGVAKMSEQMLGRMGAQGNFTKEEFADFQRKIAEAMWSHIKPDELKGDVAKIYSDLFTKEELRAMGDFYGTPAGQSMIDKQPEMQQKLMEVMMPKIMQAMPEVQKMAQDFAQTHAPKPPAVAPAAPAPQAPQTPAAQPKS